MSYVDKVLQPGETLLRRASLHWIVYGRGILLLIVALAIYIFGSKSPSYTSVFVGAALVCAVVALLLLLIAWWRQLGTEIAVTNRRVIFRRGIVSRVVNEMNVDKIESVVVRQSILGRILDYGTIDVRGTGDGLEDLRGVAAPLDLRNAITAR